MSKVYVDLSIMTSEPKCAVRCRDISEMRILRDAIMEQYPNAIPDRFNFDLAWSVALCEPERYDHSICFDMWQGTRDRILMGYCFPQWYINNGFDVIELHHLIVNDEIEETDCEIGLLFS